LPGSQPNGVLDDQSIDGSEKEGEPYRYQRTPAGSVATEMALSVLAYNLTRVMNIVGTRALLAAIGA
jgi:hypothetical protein